MENIFLFVHVLGAIAMGFYLLFPILMMRVGKLSVGAQEGYVNGLAVFNRFGQYILILQLLTGGYLISKQDYTVIWIVAVIVLFLVVAAFAGIMARPMKRLMEAIKNGKDAGEHLRKVKTFSTITSLSLLVLIVLMSFPMYN